MSEAEYGIITGIAGAFEGQRVRLRPGETVWIGSNAQNRICIQGDGVADFHCSVIYDNRRHAFEVTGQPQYSIFTGHGSRLPDGGTTFLQPGEQIQIGDHVFALTEFPEVAPVPAPAPVKKRNHIGIIGLLAALLLGFLLMQGFSENVGAPLEETDAAASEEGIDTVQTGDAAVTENAEERVAEQIALGQAALEEEDWEGAVEAFRAAIALDATAFEAYTGLIQAFDAQEDYAEAAEAMSQGLEAVSYETIDSTEQTWVVDNYLSWADSYQDDEAYEEAISVLEQGAQYTSDETITATLDDLSTGNEVVVWDDEILENMVRDKLGLKGTVHVRDLDAVEKLVILGNTHIFINDEDGGGWWECHIMGIASGSSTGTLHTYYGFDDDPDGGYTERGDITSVEALQYFRNLYEVRIIANHVSDVSVVRKMNLIYADFFANDISDTSPLYDVMDNLHFNVYQFVEIGDSVTALW